MKRFEEKLNNMKFSENEKAELIKVLESMKQKNENKNILGVKRIIAVSAAAAAIMSVSAMALSLTGGQLGKYFESSSEASKEMLEQGLYKINRSESYNGWTVSLTDCVGDDTNVYIGIDVSAPEGTVLTIEEDPEAGFTFDDYEIKFSELGIFDDVRKSWGIRQLDDDNPNDNKVSMVFEISTYKPAIGKTVNIELGDFFDYWWSDRYTDQAVKHEKTELTEGIRGHKFKFDNVKLDYSDQTIRMAPDIPVEIFSGKAVLTNLEISPLSVTATVNGGSCDNHHYRAASRPELVSEAWGEEYTPDGTRYNDFCDYDLTIEFVMDDGTVYNYRRGGGSCEDDPQKGAYLTVNRTYDKLIDLSQLKSVIICGTEIKMENNM